MQRIGYYTALLGTYALLNLLLTNKEEPDRDVEVKTSLDHSNHDIIEHRVQREMRKTNSTVYSARQSTYS